MGFFSKLFDPSVGEIKRLNKIVDKIDSFEEAHKALSDEQLRGKTVEFRERVKNGESLDDLLPEAYSIVREATYRVTASASSACRCSAASYSIRDVLPR